MYNRRDIWCMIVGIRSKIVYAASFNDVDTCHSKKNIFSKHVQKNTQKSESGLDSPTHFRVFLGLWDDLSVISGIFYKVMNGFSGNFYQRCVSGQKTIHYIWKWSGLVYDPDPIHNHCGGGFQSLTDCLVLFDKSMLLQVVPITLYLYCNIWVHHV